MQALNEMIADSSSVPTGKVQPTESLLTDNAVIASFDVATAFDVFQNQSLRSQHRLCYRTIDVEFLLRSPVIRRCINNSSKIAFHGLEGPYSCPARAKTRLASA
jgi:hypothetical protein